MSHPYPLPRELSELRELASSLAEQYEAATPLQRVRPAAELERVWTAILELEPTDANRVAYLERFGAHLQCPGSPWGRTTRDCAPAAVALAWITAASNGDAPGIAELEGAMSLVVNGADGVAEDILSAVPGDPEWLELEPVRELAKERAREAGREAARRAATWLTDGNTDRAMAARLLVMIREGDPAADSYFPRRPDLSGEWADAPTPRSLAEEIIRTDELPDELPTELADAWEEGCSEAWEPALEAELRTFLGEQD